jgi:hypothetical protein
MAGCTIFSKIDLVKAYHQIPIAKAVFQKTALANPFGLYESHFMVFDPKKCCTDPPMSPR